jgi:all-trans-retinol 13,14-reductase
MASVFRGLPHEGGSYPVGGSQNMAAALTHTVVRSGGRVLVKANVLEIVVEGGAVRGVVMDSGEKIFANRGVISSAGYAVTFNKLLPKEVCDAYHMPQQPPVGQSAGFVMVNVGIKGTTTELQIPNANIWYHPVDEHGDILPPLLS